MAEQNELVLGWDGGLHTSIDEAYIQPDKLAAMSNANFKDGTLSLDRRYILLTQLSSANATPWGSGWGKYSTGAQAEQYNFVLNSTMYLVDPASAYTFVAVTGASALNQGNWWFQQFEDYMYAGNYTDGLGRKKLATGTNGTGDWGIISVPTAPASAPTFAVTGNSYVQESFINSTISAPNGATTFSSGLNAWNITYSAVGTYSVTITFASGLRPNWEYRDLIQHTYSYVLGTGAVAGIKNMQMFVQEASGTAIAATPWRPGPNEINPQTDYLRLQNIARSNRDVVTALRYDFSISSPSGTVNIIAPYAGYVWLSLDSQTQVGNSFPNLNPLVYEYTYYNSTTGLESAPSPQLTISVAQQSSETGNWFTITPTSTSSGGGIDKIRVYRVITEGGATTRYRLAELNNTAGVNVIDKYPVDVVKTFPVSTPSSFPGSGITALGVWQERLVVARDTLLFISRQGLPLEYEPSVDDGGAFDPNSSAQGFTFYPDDTRSESIFAVVGKDALYIVTKSSIRCLFGTDPSNWTLRRLPGTEGAVGSRAVISYKDGIVYLTPSGRLLYHQLGLSEPQLISKLVEPRVANQGIGTLATSGAVLNILTTPNEEIAVYSGTGYYILDNNGSWRSGTLTHAVHSQLSVANSNNIPGYLPRWLGSNGKFYQGYDSTYVTDGGTTATNGSAVVWSATTKKFNQQRTGITNIFWGDSTPVSGSVYPSIQLITDRGTNTFTKLDNKRNKNVKITNSGYGLQFVIQGDKDTIVEVCRIELVPLSQTRHK